MKYSSPPLLKNSTAFISVSKKTVIDGHTLRPMAVWLLSHSCTPLSLSLSPPAPHRGRSRPAPTRTSSRCRSRTCRPAWSSRRCCGSWAPCWPWCSSSSSSSPSYSSRGKLTPPWWTPRTAPRETAPQRCPSPACCSTVYLMAYLRTDRSN